MIKVLFAFIVIITGLNCFSLTKKNNGSALSLYIENDSRNVGGPGSDQNYTNGIKLSYIYAENKIPSWSKPLIDWNDYLKERLKNSETNYGISLAQQIYTPNDTQTSTLIKNDRPYAGWLYVGFMARFNTSAHSDFLELDIGVVGPEAMGEKVQNEFHKLIGKETAKGWDNQINTEPGFQLAYQQRLKFYDLKFGSDRMIVDVIPYYGAAVGNIFIGAHAGGIIRIGNKLADDFGPTRLSSGDGDAAVHTDAETDYNLNSEPRIYGFAGAKGSLIGRDIFLDGNTFRDSHRVTKRAIVTETELGIGIEWARISAVWRFVVRSPQFVEKDRFTSFASISINYYL